MEDKDIGGREAGDELPELYDYRAATEGKEEVGKVVAVRGDTAQVLLKRSRYCEGCGSCCVKVDDETMLAEVANPVGAQEGDYVAVDLPGSRSIKAAYILYGVPLLTFLLGFGAGALLGYLLFGAAWSVPLGLILAFSFLAVSYVLISRVYGPRSRAAEKYRLVIKRRLLER